MTIPLRTLVLLAGLLFGIPSVAFADLTAFIGVTATPSNRPVRGFAGGIMLVIVGFEFEYADTSEDEIETAPSLRTGMGNLIVQTPFPISGLQFYGTVGGGFYRERFGDEGETSLGGNAGGGVKVTLAGPLRLRFDYRVFTLRGDAVHRRPHRVYAGLNLAF
jgi:hypothetical protein